MSGRKTYSEFGRWEGDEEGTRRVRAGRSAEARGDAFKYDARKPIPVCNGRSISDIADAEDAVVFWNSASFRAFKLNDVGGLHEASEGEGLVGGWPSRHRASQPP